LLHISPAHPLPDRIVFQKLFQKFLECIQELIECIFFPISSSREYQEHSTIKSFTSKIIPFVSTSSIHLYVYRISNSSSMVNVPLIIRDISHCNWIFLDLRSWTSFFEIIAITIADVMSFISIVESLS